MGALWLGYGPGMKRNSNQKQSLTNSLLRDLFQADRSNQKQTSQKAGIGKTPLKQPDLYQDAGGAYNQDFTFPQQ